MFRWIKRTLPDTLPNGDPVFSFTLEQQGTDGKWKNVPAFELKKSPDGKFFLVGTEAPIIAVYGTKEEVLTG
jgi:hypothetical protein